MRLTFGTTQSLRAILPRISDQVEMIVDINTTSPLNSNIRGRSVRHNYGVVTFHASRFTVKAVTVWPHQSLWVAHPAVDWLVWKVTQFEHSLKV